jgi:DNA ligase (NAD+)
MDIRGLGEALVQALLSHGLIQSPADLYTLTLEQLLTLPGIQEKSARNLLRSIQRSKRRPLPNVIFALGIRYVGAQTAQLLAEALGDLDLLSTAAVSDLEAIAGIGSKTAESIVEWMSDAANRELLDKLKAAGLTWHVERSDVAPGPLAGSTFLITGRLDAMPRSRAEARLKELGATVASGMSKSVDFLVAGAEPGSKLGRARKLGTPVKDEAWLFDVLESGQFPEQQKGGE